jgi:hypothetical protein
MHSMHSSGRDWLLRLCQGLLAVKRAGEGAVLCSQVSEDEGPGQAEQAPRSAAAGKDAGAAAAPAPVQSSADQTGMPPEKSSDGTLWAIQEQGMPRVVGSLGIECAGRGGRADCAADMDEDDEDAAEGSHIAQHL